MSDSVPLENRLKRDINRLGYSAISVNSVIGAGIFGLPAVAAARAGDFSPWVFLFCGVLIFTVVLSFARAASLVRHTGGVIVYASHAFGPFAGFQTGWLSYVARAASVGANANLLVAYASWFWAPLDTEPWRSLCLTLIVSLLTWLNVVGVRQFVTAVYVFTVLKLLPLSLLILFGLGKVDLQTLIGASPPPLDGFGETVLILLYAYVGFEGTVVTAGEGRSPRRDLPRALINTIVFIGIIYFLVQLVSMATLPDLASSDTALADVAEALMGPFGAALLTLGAVFSIGGNLSSSVLTAPRMTYVLARDGTMPAWFGHISERYRTPARSIVVYGFIGVVLAISGSFVWLAVISTLVRLLSYVICIAALPRLAAAPEALEREFKLPGGMLIPLIALLLCLWLLAQATLEAWLVLGGFFVLGTLLFLWARHGNR